MDSELVTTLRKDFKIMSETLEELKSGMPDWSRFRDTPDYKVYYKMEPGITTMSIFMEGLIKAPVMNALTVMAEA
jgi:hypothetical protein